MAYEMKTVMVDLGDGESAEVYAELKHKTNRDIQASMRKYLKIPDSLLRVAIAPNNETQSKLSIDQKAADAAVKSKIETMVGEIEIDWKNADFNEANDIMILYQVKAWTYGPVNREVLDNMPELKREALAKALNDRFKDALAPFVTRGGGN